MYLPPCEATLRRRPVVEPGTCCLQTPNLLIPCSWTSRPSEMWGNLIFPSFFLLTGRPVYGVFVTAAEVLRQPQRREGVWPCMLPEGAGSHWGDLHPVWSTRVSDKTCFARIYFAISSVVPPSSIFCLLLQVLEPLQTVFFKCFVYVFPPPSEVKWSRSVVSDSLRSHRL